MRMILDRYIAKTLTLATLLSLMIIVGVLLLMSLLGEMKALGSGDYGLMEAIEYILMRLPNELYQFSPMIILLGSVTGLSVLSSHRELTVMRSSGFSVRRIIFCVLFTSFLIVFVLSAIGEGIG